MGLNTSYLKGTAGQKVAKEHGENLETGLLGNEGSGPNKPIVRIIDYPITLEESPERGQVLQKVLYLRQIGGSINKEEPPNGS